MKHLLLFLFLPGALSAKPLDLSGTWRYNTTDSPRLAMPETDASAWPTVNLPGRYPRPETVYWLRRDFTAPALVGDVVVTVGLVSERYEVFWNGVKIGDTGDLARPYIHPVRPRSFLVPATLVHQRSPAVLALRVQDMRNVSAWGAFESAIMDRGPYWVAEPAHAAALVESAHRGRLLALAPGTLMVTIQAGVAILFFALWLSGRDQRDRLFFALYLFFLSIGTAVGMMLLLMDSSSLSQLIFYRPNGVLVMLFQTLFVAHVMRVARPPVWALSALVAVSLMMAWSTSLGRNYLQPWLLLLVLFCIRAAWIAPKGRKLFALPILAYLFAVLNNTMPAALRLFPAVFSVGLAGVAVSNLIQIVFALTMTVLMLRWIAADRREQQRLSSELEAARGVQQLLLPQAAAKGGGWQSDATYLPALEVGGDFYWTRTEPTGALVVVIGDVSGKGLKAAMLVSVAVGILRNEKSSSPCAILGALNEGLTGHTGGGFVTACCARFEAEGSMVVANAGHPAPYGDGRELEVEAGLPLGIMPDATYPESIHHADLVTLVSDGVVEAENAQRELFGFDRTRAISTKAATQIAEEAKSWGQNDDITVVTVRRNS